MLRLPSTRVITAALSVPLAVGLVGCGENDKKQAEKNATAACPSNIDRPVSTPVPSDVPTPAGGTTYQFSAQGKTRVWFIALSGSADRLSSLRDDYDAQLTGKGYRIDGTDQEPGVEAESDFNGPHDGTTNFRSLCTGKVVLRLKLTS